MRSPVVQQAYLGASPEDASAHDVAPAQSKLPRRGGTRQAP